ncbi:hypothetical protein T439DRAFT_377389 [Meredithblackwellia eburnea MCA 4105]
MRFCPTAVIALALPLLVDARAPKYEKYVSQVMGNIAYIDTKQSIGFGYWVQLADKSLIPLFNKLTLKDEMTIVMPNTEAFANFIESKGGNWSDPETLTTPAWRSIWDDTYDYFFFKTKLNTSAIAEGETVVLESYKQSPVGDWPLTIAYRREVGYAAIGVNDTVYNGTFVAEPWGVSNVSFPDYVAYPNINADLVTGWIYEPRNLSVTIAKMNVTAWTDITSRLPSIASLETQQNFTLFLPPNDILTNALAKSDADLLTFINAHLVQNTRVVLSPTAQTVKTVAGNLITASPSSVTSGSQNATVTMRDIFTNGGMVQFISASLQGNTTTAAVRERSEL